MKNPVIHYITQNHIIAGILFLLLLLFLREIRSILLLIFIAYIIMAALHPLVEILRQTKIPKVLAVALTFLSVLALLVLLIFPLVPFFISQIRSLFLNFPFYLDNTARIFDLRIDEEQVKSFIVAEMELISKNAFTVTSKVFGGFFSTLTMFVISFYLLLDHDRIQRNITQLFPKVMQERVTQTQKQIEDKLGSWLRGQLVLSLFIGAITWTALTLLGIPFALPLALLAGILEIVPTIGPIIAAIPAIIVALSISPAMAIAVAGVYIVIQALENNILVPRIMEKAVGLNPLVIIIAVIIGATLMGIAGALLAIPFVSMLVVIGRNLKKE